MTNGAEFGTTEGLDPSVPNVARVYHCMLYVPTGETAHSRSLGI